MMESLMVLWNAVVAVVAANPQVLVGLGVVLILVIRDFEELTKKLADEAIPKAEECLDKTGNEKMEEAIAYVVSLLPAQYRVLIPTPLLVMLVRQLIQLVFDKKHAALDKSAAEAKKVQPPSSEPTP